MYRSTTPHTDEKTEHPKSFLRPVSVTNPIKHSHRSDFLSPGWPTFESYVSRITQHMLSSEISFVSQSICKVYLRCCM
jgi:hypothetical protein